MKFILSSVLIVDEGKFSRLSLSHILTRAGYYIVGEANTGTDALDVYKKTHPNIVMIHSNLESIRLIKEYDPDANVIMYQKEGQEHLMTKGFSLGVKDFVMKPFSNEEVIETVQKFVQ